MGTLKVTLLNAFRLSSKLPGRQTWSKNLHDIIIIRTKDLIIDVEAMHYINLRIRICKE